jgi:hypothetical protein
MQIETAGNISRELRLSADKVKKRMWVAVPYVGGWNAVKSVLGLKWRDSSEISFRLLTDTSNKGWLDRQTIEVMNSHGKIKHLQALHAKIYIIDDRALVTSANLTGRAFSRRHEIGIFLTPQESSPVIEAFERWWSNAKLPHADWINDLSRTSTPNGKEEPGNGKSPQLFALPSAPPDGERSHPIFRDYKAFLAAYKEFAETYGGLGKRLWPKAPLFLETDMFLNYLFHEAPGKPSQTYSKTKSSRSLTEQQQRAAIKKYWTMYRKWIRNEKHDETEEIKSRMAKARTIHRLLDTKRIATIGWQEVGTVATTLHCMKAYEINASRFLNPKNNSLHVIKNVWNLLLHRTDMPIEIRMTRCYEHLDRFGQSAVQELLGWNDPKMYPIRNANSDAGLRFLGY